MEQAMIAGTILLMVAIWVLLSDTRQERKEDEQSRRMAERMIDWL